MLEAGNASPGGGSSHYTLSSEYDSDNQSNSYQPSTSDTASITIGYKQCSSSLG